MAEAALDHGEQARLRRQMARTLRRRRLMAFVLVLPLLLFILATFVYPIAGMLARSVYSPDVAADLPQTAAALAGWKPASSLPPEAAFDALAGDLAQSAREHTSGRIASALNLEVPGMRSLILGAARGIDGLAAPYSASLAALDGKWGQVGTWATLRRLTRTFTDRFYVVALDFGFDDHGRIRREPASNRIYVSLFVRTFAIAGIVTVFCLLLGFPLAYWLASLPMRHANLLLILVLLPFWTSLLVRTTAWIALLQSQGVINSLLVATGIVPDGNRLELMFNRTGTIIAMTHILLPFMILPLYSVMKLIPPAYVRAARSLGATPFTAFVRVYLPQAKPGMGAGSLLVFILALGYYITPALVGGESGTLISNMIAYHIQKSLNWGLAAALSTLLLVSVLVLYWAYSKLVRIDGLSLG